MITTPHRHQQAGQTTAQLTNPPEKMNTIPAVPSIPSEVAQELVLLARQMGCSAMDVKSFLVCIAGHMAKGMDLETAVAAHMKLVEGVFNKIDRANKTQQRNFVVGTFFQKN